jgi:hypothetical protein
MKIPQSDVDRLVGAIEQLSASQSLLVEALQRALEIEASREALGGEFQVPEAD